MLSLIHPTENRTQFEIFLKRMTCGALLASFFLTAGSLIWGMDKGFDITDEGSYLLGYQPQQEKIDVFTSFHTLVYQLFGWLNPDMVAYRWVAFLLTLASSAFFAYAFWAYLKKKFESGLLVPEFKWIFLFIASANFFWYASLPPTVSYNTFTNTILLTVSGLVLFILAKERPGALQSQAFYLPLVLIGFLTVFEFFIKQTSSILLLGMIIPVLVLAGKLKTLREGVKCAIYLLLGALAGVFVYFTCFQNLGIYLERIQNATTGLLSSESFYHPRVLIKRDLREMIRLVQFLGFSAVFYLPAFLLTVLYSSSETLANKRKQRFIQMAALTVAAIFLCYLLMGRYYPFKKPMTGTPTAFLFIFTLILLGVFNLGAYWQRLTAGAFKTKSFWQFTFTCLFLFTIPLIASFGTTNGMINQSALFVVPWMAVALLLIFSLARVAKFAVVSWLMMIAMIFWFQIQFLYGHVYAPYRLTQSLFKQTERISSPPYIKSLKVDKQTKIFFDELQEAIQRTGFKQGDPILALYNLPGVVYFLGGVSPGCSTVFPYWQEMIRNCYNLTHSGHDKSKLIVMIDSGMDPDYLNCMRRNKINFPEDFVKIGEVFNPYKGGPLEIYKSSK